MRSPGETASACDNETFDARHRVTRRSWVFPGAGTFDMAYSYMANDAVATVTYPGGNAGGLGEVVTYGYVSSTGEVESVSGTDNYVIDTDCHAAGMVTDMTHLSSGVANQMLRRNICSPSTLNLSWTEAKLTSSGTWDISQHWYTYDAWDRVTSAMDRYNAYQYRCYTYDRYNRLKTAFTTGDSACGVAGRERQRDLVGSQVNGLCAHQHQRRLVASGFCPGASRVHGTGGHHPGFG